MSQAWTRATTIAVTTVALMSSGVAVAAADSTQVVRSYAEARFLVGANGLGEVIDAVGSGLEDGGTSSGRDGTTGEQFTSSPAQELDALTVPVGDEAAGSRIGPAGNYANTSSNGAARAASGAVTQDGIVHVGGGSSPADQAATLNLSGGALQPLADAVANVRLELGAVTSQIGHGGLGTDVQRDYAIAGADLVFTMPSMGAFGQAIDGLPSSDPELADTLTLNLATVCEGFSDGAELMIPADGIPAIPGLPDFPEIPGLPGMPGDDVDLCGNIPAEAVSLIQIEVEGFREALVGLDEVTDNGVEFDFGPGELRVDLAHVTETVLGTDINDLPPHTDLVATVLPALLQNLDDLLIDGLYRDVFARSMESFDLRLTIAGQEVPIPVSDGSQTLKNDVLDSVMEQFAAAADELAGTQELWDGIDTLTDGLANVLKITVNVTDTYASPHVTAGERASSQTALRVQALNLDGEAQLADILLANSLVTDPVVVDIPEVDPPADVPPGGPDRIIPQLGINSIGLMALLGLVLASLGGLMLSGREPAGD